MNAVIIPLASALAGIIIGWFCGQREAAARAFRIDRAATVRAIRRAPRADISSIKERS